MNPNELKDAVAEFQSRFPKLVEQLGAANLQTLLAASSLQDVPKGRALFRDRLPVDCLYFVVDGELSAHIESNGAMRKIGSVRPGEWLGEVSVLSGEMQATATVIAETACRVIKVHRLSFEKLIAENQVIAKTLLDQFIELMAQRLRKQNGTVDV